MAVSRGLFLACSWTWCIGMFFPVYLVRDFGVWGWVAFAVPNVLGAGAMGVVIRRCSQSEALVARHGRMMRLFSWATILFHLCFLSWLFGLIGAARWSWGELSGPACASGALVAGLILAAMPRGWWWAAATATYVASVVFAQMAWQVDHGVYSLPRNPGQFGASAVWWCVPAMVLGFGLCPYLDLTFHRVRRDTDGRTGTMAFVIGFGVLFVPMIVLTLLYAGEFERAAALVNPWLLAHIVAQSAFSVGAHARELMEPCGVSGSAGRLSAVGPGVRALSLALVAGLVLAAVLGAILNAAPDLWRPGYSYRRLSYELFMSLYALVFPAYVWIVMIERGLGTRDRMALWVCAVVVASGCFWQGYVMQQHGWLLPGVGVVVVMPWIGRLVRARRSAAAGG